MIKKKEIFITLGPSSIKKDFLKKIGRKVNLLRLNMSHINLPELEKKINFIRKYSKIPICIDTEGSQIRTKVSKKISFKKNQKSKLYKRNKIFSFYPPEVYLKIRKGDIFDVGFENLKIQIIKMNKEFAIFKVISPGKLESNKGVHCSNRSIKLNYLTNKDIEAIKIAKRKKIKNYALSFTRNETDMIKFNELLKNVRKIFKLETKNAITNLDKMFNHGKDFLIDRGDLSKEVSIEKIPYYQRKILSKADKRNKNIFVATNCLESMLNNPYPTRAEANDIYNILEFNAKGLVLAAETAIGKYPLESIVFLKKMIKSFNH